MRARLSAPPKGGAKERKASRMPPRGARCHEKECRLERAKPSVRRPSVSTARLRMRARDTRYACAAHAERLRQRRQAERNIRYEREAEHACMRGKNEQKDEARQRQACQAEAAAGAMMRCPSSPPPSPAPPRLLQRKRAASTKRKKEGACVKGMADRGGEKERGRGCSESEIKRRQVQAKTEERGKEAAGEVAGMPAGEVCLLLSSFQPSSRKKEVKCAAAVKKRKQEARKRQQERRGEEAAPARSTCHAACSVLEENAERGSEVFHCLPFSEVAGKEEGGSGGRQRKAGQGGRQEGWQPACLFLPSPQPKIKRKRAGEGEEAGGAEV